MRQLPILTDTYKGNRPTNLKDEKRIEKDLKREIRNFYNSLPTDKQGTKQH